MTDQPMLTYSEVWPLDPPDGEEPDRAAAYEQMRRARVEQERQGEGADDD